MAISRTTQNLERAGQRVARMARMVRIHIGRKRNTYTIVTGLRIAARCRSATRCAALARRSILSLGWTPPWPCHHQALGQQNRADYDGFLRKLITYMMEDPRTTWRLNLLFLARVAGARGRPCEEHRRADHLCGHGRRCAARLSTDAR
jgi:phosphate transport system protein